ncbi:MAG: TonB-dependent receptor domain-containing protein, partial [Bryobacteraceae bacterium]
LGVGEFRIFGDGNRELTAREHGIPQFTGLPFTLQELTNGNGYDEMDTIQVGNHLSWIRGKHNLRFGGELYRATMERGAANLEEGRLTFSANESGYALASFLMGYPSNTQSPEGLPLTFPRSNRLGFYIQDDWKASSRLTINAGLRFDYVGVPVDSQGLWRTLDLPGDGGGVEGRGQGYQTPDGRTIPTIFPTEVNENGAVKLFKQRVRFFMPRLGIAYRPWDKWVIRAGAGWFDNINHLNTWTIFNLMPPKSGSLDFNSVTDNARTISVPGADGGTYDIRTRMFRPGAPILTLDDPFLTRSGAAANVRPVNLSSLPPDTFDGDVWKWSFDIQRELPFNTVVTVGYAGSKGTHVGNSLSNFNQAPPSSNTNIQARRPYPEFFDPALPERGIQALGNIRYIDSYGESFYHGLQAKLDKRYARGITVGIAYTLSKAHGDGENGGQEGASFQDPRDRVGSRGRYRFDQRHNFVAHYVWELPGRNLPGVLKHIAGGWQTNGIVSLRSGFPFT